MSDAWREEARKRLPDLTSEVGGWGEPGSWSVVDAAKTLDQLCLSMAVAIWTLYDQAGIIGERIIHSEPDREKIASIYGFAWWCIEQPNLRGIVLFYFWESLDVNIYIPKDMPAFLSSEQLKELAQEGITSKPA